MNISKKELIKDLEFCKDLMNRLVDYAKANYPDDPNKCWVDRKHTVIQADIIRLRRELNGVKAKLDWNYEKR